MLERQRHVTTAGRATLIHMHRTLRLTFAVVVRLEAGFSQLVGHRTQVLARLLQEGVLGVVSSLARAAVTVAVDMLDTPVLRQHHVALGAGLLGAGLGLLGHGAHRLGCGLGDSRSQQLSVEARRFLGAGHAVLVHAGIVARGLPKAQQVRLDLVAEVLGHHRGVLREVAHARFDVGARDGHAVHHQLGINAAVELA